MKKYIKKCVNIKTINLFLFSIMSFLFLSFNVNAEEDFIYELDNIYSYFLTQYSLEDIKVIDEYLDEFVKNNLDVEKTYIATRKNSNLYLYELKNGFLGFNQAQGGIIEENVTVYQFWYNSGSWINDGQVLDNQNLNYSIRSFFDFNGLFWSNKSLKFNGILNDTYYYYKFTNVNTSLLNYYTLGEFHYDSPIYTFCNLMLGDYGGDEVFEKFNYKVEYYFDDLIDTSKTENLSAIKGAKITNFTDYSSDIYKLYKPEGTDYSIIIDEDETKNILKIYYRSPYYGTDKQPIDTDVDGFYFFFNFSDIRSLFPTIEFGNFSQFEQFIIVICFNLFYCLFLFFVIYLIIKMLYKGMSWLFSYFS